jgi:hypothetical protein
MGRGLQVSSWFSDFLLLLQFQDLFAESWRTSKVRTRDVLHSIDAVVSPFSPVVGLESPGQMPHDLLKIFCGMSLSTFCCSTIFHKN